MASPARVTVRSVALFACLVLNAGCQDDTAPAAGEAGPSDGAPAAAVQPAPPAASASSTWEGEVTGGYTGNRISFTVSPEGGQVGDVTFEGHWDCSDGIETTTAGPSGTFPIQQGRLEITSVDPPDGGATATRFVLTGQVDAARAEGTLRINLNALGCDTGELSWTAAPVAP